MKAKSVRVHFGPLPSSRGAPAGFGLKGERGGGEEGLKLVFREGGRVKPNPLWFKPLSNPFGEALSQAPTLYCYFYHAFSPLTFAQGWNWEW